MEFVGLFEFFDDFDFGGFGVLEEGFGLEVEFFGLDGFDVDLIGEVLGVHDFVEGDVVAEEGLGAGVAGTV